MPENKEELPVRGGTDSLILKKGRYPFETVKAVGHTSDRKNKCCRITQEIEGRLIDDDLIVKGADEKSRRMEYRWREYLYASGIRDKRTFFTISMEKLKGLKGLADVGVKPGFFEPHAPENVIRGYSSIKEETAPIKGVEPEDITKTELEKTKKGIEDVMHKAIDLKEPKKEPEVEDDDPL